MGVFNCRLTRGIAHETENSDLAKIHCKFSPNYSPDSNPRQNEVYKTCDVWNTASKITSKLWGLK